MRKLIVVNIMSLDGYFEGAGKNVMVMPMDGAFDAYNLEAMESAGTILLGGNSYRFFGAFWPNMAENQETSEINRTFAKIYNKIDKVAVSKDLKESEFPELWRDTTTVISDNVYEEIQKLKEQDGKNIVMFASRNLWNDLLAHGLVDELHFVTGNVVLGEGTKMFTNPVMYDDPKTGLKLLETHMFENSSNHLVKFEVVNK